MISDAKNISSRYKEEFFFLRQEFIFLQQEYFFPTRNKISCQEKHSCDKKEGFVTISRKINLGIRKDF